MLNEKYASLASYISTICSLMKDNNISVSELYKTAKNNLIGVPNPERYPGNGEIVASFIETLKADMEGVVTDGDKAVQDLMTEIVERYKLSNESELLAKIREGITAIEVVNAIANIITTNTTQSFANTQQLIAYIDSLFKNLGMANSTNNALFTNYNAISNENALLKARIAELEMQLQQR